MWYGVTTRLICTNEQGAMYCHPVATSQSHTCSSCNGFVPTVIRACVRGGGQSQTNSVMHMLYNTACVTLPSGLPPKSVHVVGANVALVRKTHILVNDTVKCIDEIFQIGSNGVNLTVSSPQRLDSCGRFSVCALLPRVQRSPLVSYQDLCEVQTKRVNSRGENSPDTNQNIRPNVTVALTGNNQSSTLPSMDVRML